MSKVKAKKTKVKDIVAMQVVNPYSAGIDVGDKEMVVAVPEGLSEPRVRTFGTMTCNLEEIATYLKTCEIDTVRMESTGVYWKPLFRKLIHEGIEVFLVNAAHVKNMSGRKDDENDAMWIQKLHSCGLLKSSYLPDEDQEALRTLVRHRKTMVQDASRFVNRMQKSLELMNVKFHTVISDIVGQTGCAVGSPPLTRNRQSVPILKTGGECVAQLSFRGGAPPTGRMCFFCFSTNLSPPNGAMTWGRSAVRKPITPA